MSGEDDTRDERRKPREEYEDPAFVRESQAGGAPYRGSGHVSGDVEWVGSDEDDPDAGSGRTDADDGGYLPGEGTGRPYR